MNIRTLLFITSLTNAFDSSANDILNQKEAAQKIQRLVKKHTYQKKERHLLEENYQQGLKYRNGEVAGFIKDTPEAQAFAGAYFLRAAHFNHLKAIHNLAMIFYKKKDYNAAYRWFSKAASQDFEPSKKNLLQLVKEMRPLHPLPTFPDEIWLNILSHINENMLLTFRKVNFKAAVIVDDIFKCRGSIKVPFNCFTQEQKTHPFPHTISYFLRKHMDDAGSLLWQLSFKGEYCESSKPQTTWFETMLEAGGGKVVSLAPKKVLLDKYKIDYNLLRLVAKFSREWNFPGEYLISFLSELNSQKVVYDTHIYQFTDRLLEKMKSRNDTDMQEIRLSVLLNIFHRDHATTKKFSKICENLIRTQRQDIAFHFINRAGLMLSLGLRVPSVNKYNIENAKRILKIAADLGDPEAQRNLGLVFYNNHEVEQGNEYLEKAANQNDFFSIAYCAILSERQGNFKQHKLYMDKADFISKSIPQSYRHLPEAVKPL